MESTSETAGPLTRFRWNSILVYSHTILHRLWRLVPCCLVLFAVTGCHRAQKKVVTEHHYVSPSDTLMITYPPNWKENPLKMTKVIDVVLSAPDNAGSLLFAESSNFDAPMLDLDRIYETYLIYNRFLDFNLTIVSNVQSNVAGFAAMKMYGYRDGRPVEAFLIQNDFHIYELFAVPDADTPGNSFFEEAHAIIQKIQIHPEKQDANENTVLSKQQQDQLPEGWTAETELRNGELLLASRDVSVDNYSEAMNSFRKVLAHTYEEDPRPDAYYQAARLLQISKLFRFFLYEKYKFQLDKAMGMGEREEALKYADLLLRLYPTEGQQLHDYAVLKKHEAMNLHFNN